MNSLFIVRQYFLIGVLMLFMQSIAPAQTFRVMSFNIFEGGRDRLDKVFDFITSNQVDIALIQESSTQDGLFESKAKERGYYVVQNKLNTGILEPAILSKYKIVDVVSQHRSIQALIELPNGTNVKVHIAHFPPLELNQERVFLMRQNVNEYLKADREQYPVVFGGDLNVWTYQSEVLGQLPAIGFKQDVFDRLDYIYSYGLTTVAGSSRVLGNLALWPTEWISDHTAVMVDYVIPQPFVRHSQSFSLSNNFRQSFNFKAVDFVNHFQLGSLTAVQIVKLPSKGKLSLPNASVEVNAVISVNDLDKLTYRNEIIGLDEWEWLGIASSGPARHSSFVRIENSDIITSFDRSKCYYDIGLLNSGTSLYFGSNDQFVDASGDSLKGAEFIKFPTYISYFNNHTLEDYFSFTISRPATLYLAFDDRHVTPPSWVHKNFTLTSITFSSNDHPYQVYRKKIGAGTFRFGYNNMNWERRSQVDHFVMIIVPQTPIVGLLEQSEEFSIYPVPSSGILNFKFGQTYRQVEVTIINSLGQVYRKLIINDADQFSESINESGYYWIRVKTETQERTQKVFIQK